jgi:two-component system phosphate regulon response regulator PhoB
MRNKKKTQVLLVEDEEPIRQMLKMALTAADFQVIEAKSVKHARRHVSLGLPDLFLLDWMLPDISGVEYTRELKRDRLTKNIPIILLTARATEENKVKGLEAGADDYIVKPFSPRELVARIHAVLRRGPLKDPTGVIQVDGLVVDTEAELVTADGEPVKLGPLEYRLLAFFAMHQERVYSRDDLLSHVWGVSAYLDQRTVDVHIRRLRKRLAPYGYDRLLQTIHGSGYRFSLQGESS